MTKAKPTQEQLSAYFFNECDDLTISLVEEWFYHFGKTEEASVMLHELWKELELNMSESGREDAARAFNLFRSRLENQNEIRKKPLRVFANWFGKVAAILVVQLLAGSVYWYLQVRNDAEIQWVEKSVAYGEIEKVVLPDGSVVWLNAGSTILYPERFSSRSRQIFLDGEGYFDVSPDKFCPMRVTVKGNTVEVLGTSFNLRAYKEDDMIDLSLLEGSVAFSPAGTRSPVCVLSPGEALSYNTAEKHLTQTCFSKDNFTIWKEGGLYFKNKPLADIARQLERTFNLKIIFRNSQVRNIRYHMAFVNNESIDEILDYIDRDSRITVERNGDIVEIY